ncbi:MAG TPA: LemA family protein [Thermoanaerobaculia bacterium]|jgi:LemA protein
MGKLGLGCLAILIALVVIVGLSFVGTYNRLVTLSQDVDRSWSEVENQYQRRADLVPNLVSTVQGAATFEKETLTAVTEARASVGRATITPGKAPTDAETLARYQQAQDQLGAALQRLLVVSERYPELKANQNFRDLQAQLEGTENRIAVARGRFNESAQAYNTRLMRFPTNLMGRFLGFKDKPYFKATTPGAEQAPKVRFDFSRPAPTAAPVK